MNTPIKKVFEKKLSVNYLKQNKHLFDKMLIDDFKKIINKYLNEGINDYLINNYENELVNAYHLIGLPLLKVYDYFTKGKQEWIQLNNEVKIAMNNIKRGISFLKKRGINLNTIASRINNINKNDYNSFLTAYSKLGLEEFIRIVYENISFIETGKAELLDFEVEGLN